MKPYLFLLGGHDLEMVEIRALLEKHQLAYVDRQLAWGATWSDYQDIINEFDWESRHLVGIELSGPKPEQAILIDHHNELSAQPASIEQITNLLGISLSRHQQLVAENDKGYIPAMRKWGATEEEVQRIRRLDRKAQGITEKMERIAEADCRIKNYCSNVTIIKTKLTKFSPIVDRLQVSRLLIYNDSELTYYGDRSAELAQVFALEVAEGKAYYGGGANGFFGVARGWFSEEEIGQFVERICTYFYTL
ncbi:hypothetical protein ACO2Q8_28775 [Larkinella sp. VNQ87]|uniref:hypothetical protein n=1 Tax=Larkinella sp. VNQ87 TaxID=3400921 RepID=UPI003C057D3C